MYLPPPHSVARRLSGDVAVDGKDTELHPREQAGSWGGGGDGGISERRQRGHGSQFNGLVAMPESGTQLADATFS